MNARATAAEASTGELAGDAALAVIARAEPAERAAVLLELIAGRGGVAIDLSKQGGQVALLRNVELGAARLAEIWQGPETPSWMSPASGGVDLRDANLAGADFGGADLSCADLRGATLNGAMLEKANLNGALLDAAQLVGADLAGADLRGARLGSANLEGALIEDADLSGAFLRFARLNGAVLEGADLRGADLWSASLAEANLVRANLRGLELTEINLTRADLSEADLRGASISDCRLPGAMLRGTSLSSAVCRRNDLRGADLREADCSGVDLTTCQIDGLGLCNAWLEKTRLNLTQLGGSVGEERAKDYDRAALAYSALERNFSGLNDREGAVWAYLRRRRMQKALALEQTRAAWRAGSRRLALRPLAKYVSDQLTELLCDYGESVPRVLGALVILFSFFTLIYAITGSVLRAVPGIDGAKPVVTQNLWDVALFSFLCMTSGAPSGELAPRDDIALMLTGIQLFIGVALIGLLGFVLGNRIRR